MILDMLSRRQERLWTNRTTQVVPVYRSLLTLQGHLIAMQQRYHLGGLWLQVRHEPLMQYAGATLGFQTR